MTVATREEQLLDLILKMKKIMKRERKKKSKDTRISLKKNLFLKRMKMKWMMIKANRMKKEEPGLN